MYCAQCGLPNDDNAYRCVSCNEVLVRVGEAGAPAKTYLVEAILVTLFCCQIPGIVAIVYAAVAMGNNSGEKYAAAHDAAGKAKTWVWVSVGAGLVVFLVYFLLGLYGAMASAGTTP